MEPKKAFAVELGASWKRWARHRSSAELVEINRCLHALVDGFGKPHVHAGLGLRRLAEHTFEFRVSRELRVVFLLIKPRTIRLAMCGNHDEVRTWLKSNS